MTSEFAHISLSWYAKQALAQDQQTAASAHRDGALLRALRFLRRVLFPDFSE
jgi:hypothetical protein